LRSRDTDLLPSAVKKVWGKEGRLVTVVKEKHTTCNTSLEVCTCITAGSILYSRSVIEHHMHINCWYI